MGEREDKLLREFQEEFGMFTYDEERAEFVMKTWVTTGVRMVSFLAEKLGWDKVNDLLKDYWKERAEQRMKYNVARVTTKGEPRDCVTLGRMVTTNKAGMGDFEFIEITPTRLHLTQRGCDESAVLKETGYMGKLFWPCTTIWREAYGKELNPKIKFTSLKAECEGDDCCEHVWELEE